MTSTRRGPDTQTQDADPIPGPLPPAFVATGPRYRDLGLLGVGGMGEVRRVADALLDRTVAMKLIRGDLFPDARAVAAFLSEAKVHARLQHPNIVPVYDLGVWTDGRVYFTMKEVSGQTLRERIRAGSWSLRRGVEALLAVCEGVAFAHAAGVIHRDLKPGNIMIGDFGEVLVMDWGLARACQAPVERPVPRALGLGVATGTAPYMPPEQAFGDPPDLDPRADVYALGATLYELLAGRPPFAGDADTVLAALRAGPPPDIASVAAFPLPPALVDLTRQAMARDRADRPADAGALVVALRAWLDGLRRREEAGALVAEADALAPRLGALREQARVLEREANAALNSLPLWAPEAEKRPSWARLSEAAALAREADLAEVDWLQKLRGALNLVDDLPEAHERLAAHYRARHAAAEAASQPAETVQAEALLRVHDRGRFARYLRGEGALTLLTDPPGASVSLYRYALEHRRLVAHYVRDLGPTPLIELPLEMGSAILILRAEGCAELRYPVTIGREQHHAEIPPEGDRPQVLRLPRLGELSDTEIFVPAGWFLAGDDRLAPRAWPSARRWCEAFVLQREPVTVADWLDFLHAGACDATDPSLAAGPPGALLRWQSGGWSLGEGAGGVPPRLDWPVLGLSWVAASAYAAWRRERDGLPWQLPWERWWEKAARGTDGRAFPMGPHLDPGWAATRDSGPVALGPSPVGAHPGDESPYGARGLAGNVRCWCQDRSDAGTYPARGGAWNFPTENCRSALRTLHTPDTVASNLGFRLARPARGG